MKRLLTLSLLLLTSLLAAAQGTYLFAERDTCELYLDVYPASRSSERLFEGHPKPTILFVFGGGFVAGERSHPGYRSWFRLLNENGYQVITVDYRLGLKGEKMRFDLFHLIESAKKTQKAVDLGVEDVFEAVRYILDNAETLDVAPDNLVIAGSSAGAMIALSSVLETCSGSPRTGILPEGFRFAGAMSFAGAIMSDSGKPEYGTPPPPQLLLHGTKDGAVAYNKMGMGKYGLWGSSALVRKVLAKKGYPYHIYRYQNHPHDIAGYMHATWEVQRKFLEEAVMRSNPAIVDVLVDEKELPILESVDLKGIYH